MRDSDEELFHLPIFLSSGSSTQRDLLALHHLEGRVTVPLVPYVKDADMELYVGDALTVLRELQAASVDAVVTDPPYGDTSLEWDVPVAEWMPLVARVLKPSGSVWCFGSLRMFMEHQHEFDGWRYAQEIVWEKHNGSSFHADRFKRVHELAVQWYRGAWGDIYKQPVKTMDATARRVRKKGRPPHMGEIGPNVYVSEDGGPRFMRSVIYVRSCHGHAVVETQKPEGILRPLIEYSCPPGGVVLDPFAGSGSTGIASRQLGRRAVLIEKDPTTGALAAERLAQLSLLAETTG